MSSYTDTELSGLANGLYEEKNDHIEYQTHEDEHGNPVVVKATQGEVIHYYDVGDAGTIGRIQDIYITTGDLMDLTGYSRETIRRRMNGLVDAGIFINHGVATDHDRDATTNLYLPSQKPMREKARILAERDGRSLPPALTSRTPVTPTDFEAGSPDNPKGIFYYKRDPTKTVDVREPSSGSIRESVSAQLEEYGLVATDIGNFSHKLREWAGFTGDS